MPDRPRIIVYIRPGRTYDQQTVAIADYCRAHKYQGVAQAHHPEDAAALVRSGAATIVVAAFDPRDGLRRLVAAAGGSVEFVREPRQPTTVATLFQKLLRRGRTPHDIAQMHDMDTTDVRAILRRAEEQHPQRRPPE